MKIPALFSKFIHSEKMSGTVLVAVSVISIIAANSGFQTDYIEFWHKTIAGKPFEFWINDALMTIFFLLVGLEIEREFYNGELSDRRKAMLPVIAALGGMLVPAAIHLMLNYGSETQNGFGIPMATDIAFSLAVLSLLGDRVPLSLKVFLTALAIIDDLGAILVIAIFYSGGISILYLSLFLFLFAVLILLNRLKVHNGVYYILIAIVMWYCLYMAGIHPTITGVVLAFALPFGKGDEHSVSYRWQKKLHLPVACFIVPLFAMANTAIPIDGNLTDQLFTRNGSGIILGLFIGKPLGIFIFSMVGVLSGFCVIPPGTKKIHLIGAGFLGGIGFTMSIFITLLAFQETGITAGSKLAIITASVISALVGYIILKFSFPQKPEVTS